MKILKKMLAVLAGIILILNLASCERNKEPINASGNTTDVIIWYDIDISVKFNSRPDNGWLALSPWGQDDAEGTGAYRATTPLMGLYDQQEPSAFIQHLYWFEASKIDVIAYDLTNWRSPKEKGTSAGMLKYFKGVLANSALLHKTIEDIFSPVKAYPTLRLNGEEYDNLQLMLDELYELYEQYPETWYKLNDGSENKDKPFICIFTDWSLLDRWGKEGIPFQDKSNRFNVRWSNGFLAQFPDITRKVDDTMKKIPADLPYWLFVENEPLKAGEEGYYMGYYKESENFSRPEQMITWASIFKQDGKWDGMIDEIDGKKTLERYSWPLDHYTPQTLLVNRWNYPVVWKEEPQEGVSLNHGTNIEPNVNFGFDIYNDMVNLIYKVKKAEKTKLPDPKFVRFDASKNLTYIALEGYPLEIRLSNNKDNPGEWKYINVSDGISLEGIDTEKTIYVQTRNTFMESNVIEYNN